MRGLSVFTNSHHFRPYCRNHNNLGSFSSSSPKSSSFGWVHVMSAHHTTTYFSDVRRQNKIIVIMAPTGCGKSKLSVDLASRIFPESEIINSDKIQVYCGLDITTNKIPLPERNDVPHHLLGDFCCSDSHPEFTPSDFRSSASSIISQIVRRQRIPFIVGGSNSFLYGLLAEKFDPDLDVFSEANSREDSVFCKELRYRCCFIWIDVALPVLNEYLVKRVDDMLDFGMFEELADYFEGPDSQSASKCGLKKAIGVPEFEKYFKRFNNKKTNKGDDSDDEEEEEEERRVAYEEAVRAIKDNTCQLAERQMWKILRLRDAAGWDLKRVDATASIRAAMESGGGRRVAEIWEREVLQPSVNIVKQFLME